MDGKNGIARAGGDDNQVEAQGRNSAQLQRLLRRLRTHVRGEFVVRSNPPLPNPGAAENPLVARIDHLLQVGVAEHTTGQVSPRG